MVLFDKMKYTQLYDYVTTLEKRIVNLKNTNAIKMVDLVNILDDVGVFVGQQYPLLKQRFDSCVEQLEQLYVEERNKE